jgi:hypothetical protein
VGWDMSDFNLSEKIVNTDGEGYVVDWIRTKDVKEFIFQIKQVISNKAKDKFFEITEEIDKLAGEKLR